MPAPGLGAQFVGLGVQAGRASSHARKSSGMISVDVPRFFARSAPLARARRKPSSPARINCWSSRFTFCATERSTTRRAAITSTNSIRNEPNGSSWRDWSGWDLMLFCGTRLPTPLRHHQHHPHPLQAADMAAPVNASNVELPVNTGSNKSSFSKSRRIQKFPSPSMRQTPRTSSWPALLL